MKRHSSMWSDVRAPLLALWCAACGLACATADSPTSDAGAPPASTDGGTQSHGNHDGGDAADASTSDAGASLTMPPPPADAGAPELWASRYLHTDGMRFKDATGKAVDLRGVNLGGWLVTEDWMDGIQDDTDRNGRAVLATLESRFTEAQAQTLINTWRDRFITAADLDDIKSLGFNLVRVPLSYRNFQQADGTWILNAQGEADFSRLDWLVTQAAIRGIYVDLDFHYWYGQEKTRLPSALDGGSVAATNAYNLITCGPSGDEQNKQQQMLDDFWAVLAKHYLGNGNIAFFEAINEPCGGTWAFIPFYPHLRAADPQRIFYAWGDPYKDTMSWTNAIFGPHQYDVSSTSFAADQATIDSDVSMYAQNQAAYGVPYFSGEFHVLSTFPNYYQSWDYLLAAYNAHHISWTIWTYKGVNVGEWALVDYNTSDVRVDAAHDSFDTILAKWQALATAPITKNATLRARLSAAATAP